MSDVCKCRDWVAAVTSVSEDAETMEIRVTGTCECEPGIRLSLDYGNSGANPDPRVVALRLIPERDAGAEGGSLAVEFLAVVERAARRVRVDPNMTMIDIDDRFSAQ